MIECKTITLLDLPGPVSTVACARQDPINPQPPDPNPPPPGSGCSAALVNRAPCLVRDMRSDIRLFKVTLVSPNYGGLLNNENQTSITGDPNTLVTVSIGSFSVPGGDWCDHAANFPLTGVVVNGVATSRSYGRFGPLETYELFQVEVHYRHVGDFGCQWQLGDGKLWYRIPPPPVLGVIGGTVSGVAVITGLHVESLICSPKISFDVVGTLAPPVAGTATALTDGQLSFTNIITGCTLHGLTGSFRVRVQEL